MPELIEGCMHDDEPGLQGGGLGGLGQGGKRLVGRGETGFIKEEYYSKRAEKMGERVGRGGENGEVVVWPPTNW